MPTSPESELEEFLASKPAWLERALWGEISSLSRDEQLEWINSQDEIFRLRQQYESVLKRIPAKWNKYCQRCQKSWAETERQMARLLVPRGRAGARRKDALAQEAIQLQERGRNFPQIAAELDKRHGKGTTTTGAIAKLVKRFLARTKSND